jgi:RNA polymerase sigma-70 factor (ECF subfamily)
METILNDHEMVLEAQRGSAAAQEAIYRKYFNVIWNKSNCILKNREDALDIAQEVFFRVLVQNKIITFRAQAKFSTWLIQIARNLCFTRLLQKKRRHENYQPVDFILERECLYSAHLENPEEILIREEKIDFLHCLVSQLPDKYADSLRYYFGDFSYIEAAQEACISVSHYGLRISRAKKMIWKKIRKENPEIPAREAFNRRVPSTFCWDGI